MDYNFWFVCTTRLLLNTDRLFREKDSELMAHVRAVEAERHQGTAYNVLFCFCI